jgi:fructose-1,6-bisphosphatase/inositol monophosphatase family enzyme
MWCVCVALANEKKTLVTMINNVAMVTNVTIVNIGKLVMLATKVNMQ